LKKNFIGVLLGMVLASTLSFQTQPAPTLDRMEARKAFVLINQVRKNPAVFFKELHLNASLKITSTQLVWNDTLARVAEQKALDMAKRNYFEHEDPDGYGMNYFINKAGYILEKDWLDHPKNNYFESLGAGYPDGIAAVKGLIIDKDVPSMGHRNHLLGIGINTKYLQDIGIGFVRIPKGREFTTYMSVVIAKHQWVLVGDTYY